MCDSQCNIPQGIKDKVEHDSEGYSFNLLTLIGPECSVFGKFSEPERF